MTKTLIILVGLKGSGKTHIGSVIDAHTEADFIHVEPIWLSLEDGQDGWHEIELDVLNAFKSEDTIIIESLGISEGFHRLRKRLQAHCQVKYVRVTADPQTCLERVRKRSSTNHIPVSDARVEKYNQIASKVNLDWAGEIENDPPAPDEVILQCMHRIQQGSVPDTFSSGDL